MDDGPSHSFYQAPPRLSVLTFSLNGILIPPACLVIDTLHKFTRTDLSFYLIFSFCRDCILDISYSLFSQH